jgi:DNA-binding response OmpR family regulator/predicted regulator of Ras-like GTPase activity (Roadblock/LC7/MglB family)
MCIIVIVTQENPGVVLLVSAEEELAGLLKATFAERDISAEVRVATDGGKALADLHYHRPQLVIAEREIPVLNGLELLLNCRRHHPELPVVLVTEGPAEQFERQAQILGAAAVWQRPLEPGSAAESVKQLLRREPPVERPTEGFLRGVSVKAALLALADDGRSGALEFRTTTGQQGTLWVDRGELVDAVVEDRHGDEALEQLLSWTSADLTVLNGQRERKKTITTTLARLQGVSRPPEVEESAKEGSSPPPKRSAAAGRTSRLGYLEDFNIPGLVQLLALERRTCKLSLQAVEGIDGVLWMKEGYVIDAETDGTVGDEAALELLAWPGADITLEHFDGQREAAISKPIDYLLFESARRLDENNRPSEREPREKDSREWVQRASLMPWSLMPAGTHPGTDSNVSLEQSAEEVRRSVSSVSASPGADERERPLRETSDQALADSSMPSKARREPSSHPAALTAADLLDQSTMGMLVEDSLLSDLGTYAGFDDIREAVEGARPPAQPASPRERPPARSGMAWPGAKSKVRAMHDAVTAMPPPPPAAQSYETVAPSEPATSLGAATSSGGESRKAVTQVGGVEEILTVFNGANGIAGVALFSGDGEIIGQLPGGVADMEEVGAFAVEILLKAKDFNQAIGASASEVLQLNTNQGTALMAPIPQATAPSSAPWEGGPFLVAVIRSGGNTALAKILLKRTLPQVAEFLG